MFGFGCTRALTLSETLRERDTWRHNGVSMVRRGVNAECGSECHCHTASRPVHWQCHCLAAAAVASKLQERPQRGSPHHDDHVIMMMRTDSPPFLCYFTEANVTFSSCGVGGSRSHFCSHTQRNTHPSFSPRRPSRLFSPAESLFLPLAAHLSSQSFGPTNPRTLRTGLSVP